MKHKRIKTYEEQKNELVKKVISTITTSILLLGINLMFSPGFMWSKIVIFIMAITLISKILHFVFTKPKRSDGYDYSEEEALDLRPLQRSGRTWKDSDLVEGNSRLD